MKGRKMFTLYVQNSRGVWEKGGLFILDDESIKTAVEYGKTFKCYYLRPDTYKAKVYLDRLGLL